MFGILFQPRNSIRGVYIAKIQPSERLGDECVRMRTYSKVQPHMWKTYSKPRPPCTPVIEEPIPEINTETTQEEEIPPCPFLNPNIPPCPFLPSPLDGISNPPIKSTKHDLANSKVTPVEEFMKTWEKITSNDIKRQPTDQIVKTPQVKKVRLEITNNDLFQRPSSHSYRKYVQPFEKKDNRVIIKTGSETHSENCITVDEENQRMGPTISNSEVEFNEPILKTEQDADRISYENLDFIHSIEGFETIDNESVDMDITEVKTDKTETMFSETNEHSSNMNTLTHKTIDNQSKSNLNLAGLHGNRLVDIHKVLNWAFELGKHSTKCGNIMLNQELRDGFRSTFVFNCDNCNKIFEGTNGDMGGSLESALADVYSFLEDNPIDANTVIKCENEDMVIDECKNPLDEDVKPIL